MQQILLPLVFGQGVPVQKRGTVRFCWLSHSLHLPALLDTLNHPRVAFREVFQAARRTSICNICSSSATTTVPAAAVPAAVLFLRRRRRLLLLVSSCTSTSTPDGSLAGGDMRVWVWQAEVVREYAAVLKASDLECQRIRV